MRVRDKPPDLTETWTQEQLRNYLLVNGWKLEDFLSDETIPQGVKYINFEPLTEAEIKWAQDLIAEHPEWCASENHSGSRPADVA
jgi:hypothetical protein